jgi:hypothetical protein
VRQLVRAADHASKLGRMARAIELLERALAAAEADASLRGSLVLPALLHDTVHMCARDTVSRLYNSSSAAGMALPETLNEAVFYRTTLGADGTTLLSLSQRSLALFHARWRAGSLLALMPQEVAYCGGSMREAQQNIARTYIFCADDAAGEWPPLRSPAEDAARMSGIYGALRVALEADAQGLTLLDTSSDDMRINTLVLHSLLRNALADNVLRRLRATCGLTHDEEVALMQLAQRADACMHEVRTEKLQETAGSKVVAHRERAAADVARHGLRRCALPECGATEPNPKAFKLCGRCRAVVYCGGAHQEQDWRRHKRSDGCKAAA